MTTRTGRGWLATVTAGTVALLALAGCGISADDGGSDGRDAAGEEQAGAPPGEDQPPADGEPPPGGGEPGGVAGGAVVDTRSIVYTGEIMVRVPDVDRAARTATELAGRLGGFVAGDQRSTADEPQFAEATLVLRVPADEFTGAVDELARLGDEEFRAIRTEDVTEEVVDLDARIATAQASVDRTRTLLEQANSIDDIVKVEAELSEREATLASLQARQRRLADLTALSTITATLLAEAAPARAEERTGFVAGLAAGWRGLTGTATVLLTGLGVLLPWLVTLAIPATAGIWWARRRRVPGPAPAGGPPAAGPPAAGPPA